MRELDEDEVFAAFYAGISPSKIYAPNVHYNEIAKQMGLELIPEKPEFDGHWFMPEFYQNLDVVEYFANKITTDEQATRIAEELQLFLDSGNEKLLQYAVYLGDVIRENGVVTGVGRGSSVSVYLFYLAGLHKVDSIRYRLEYKDFFKIKEGE